MALPHTQESNTMFPWTIKINLYNEKDQLVAETSEVKYFATERAAMEYAHEQGQKACDKVPGWWYTIGVE